MTSSPLNSDHQKKAFLKEGLSLFEAAQWEQSFEVFSDLLQLEPLNFEALHHSALILLRQEKLTQALPFLRRAVAVEPNHLQSLRNLSWVLFNLGNHQEALEFADQRLALDSNALDALSLKAQIQTQLGTLEEAYSTWLLLGERQPQSADIQNNLGVVCHQRGDFVSALDHYARAQELAPGDAKIAFNKAVSLEKLQKYSDAIQSYQFAIQLDHQYKDAFFNLGLLLMHERLFGQAIEAFDRILSMDPKAALALMNKAVALQKLKDLKAAQIALERAIELDASSALIYFNLAAVLQDQRQLQSSAQVYEQALKLDPSLFDAWCNWGDVCHDLQDLGRATACYEEALRLVPDSVRAQYHLSLTYLLSAQFEKAWPLFEYRREYQNAYLALQSKRQSLDLPLWTGQVSPMGKQILVMCEQGLGDSIQFVRYVSHLAQMGARIVLQAPEPLLALFKNVPGVFHWVPHSASMATEAILVACDFYVPMMSLPFAMGAKYREPFFKEPYLQVSDAVLQKWKSRMGAKTCPRVGLVWSGGHREDQPWTWEVNQRRNIALKEFEVLSLAGLEFFSVQKGEKANQELSALEEKGWRGPALVNWMNEVNDFEETAALMEQLDLLISVDTSTAHLAGALGKPVWLLNRFDTCWRWQLERSDSPWYPSMKIYRQSELDSWAGVMKRVRDDLTIHFSLN